MAEIKSINELLKMEIDIPDYQRPYKWTIQNIEGFLVILVQQSIKQDCIELPSSIGEEHLTPVSMHCFIRRSDIILCCPSTTSNIPCSFS